MKSEKITRIGIYAGTFDPVHAGHVTFALQALKESGLDMVYFLPERRPRHKKGVEHFGHRVAMLKQAIQPHPKFSVLELDDVSFSVVRTLPSLQTRFRNSQLVLLFGSDAIKNLPSWPRSNQLLSACELIIGCRKEDNPKNIEYLIASWADRPKSYAVLKSYAPQVSSGRIRSALQKHQPVQGILKSVERYSNKNWLYISLAVAPKR
ncbi:MAG TPA: nicotinate (nicotinamide) nucleotide adenylyltransferase [Candidatus Saccharimonadales bacterium]|nr:nicotinate (nicotinamide) nucleotide adenylyltransferase [Candidatus Saccharimonadales bacterium]